MMNRGFTCCSVSKHHIGQVAKVKFEMQHPAHDEVNNVGALISVTSFMRHRYSLLNISAFPTPIDLNFASQDVKHRDTRVSPSNFAAKKRAHHPPPNSAGVSGLTCALLLARNGNHNITIVAKHMPGDYDIEYASPWAGKYM